jgi:hypothetical protein
MLSVPKVRGAVNVPHQSVREARTTIAAAVGVAGCRSQQLNGASWRDRPLFFVVCIVKLPSCAATLVLLHVGHRPSPFSCSEMAMVEPLLLAEKRVARHGYTSLLPG